MYKTCQIHMEFVKLVESLLESVIKELDMTTEEFISLVNRSGAEKRDALMQVVSRSTLELLVGLHGARFIFSRVQAVEGVTDFDVFLSMVHEVKENGSLA